MSETVLLLAQVQSSLVFNAIAATCGLLNLLPTPRAVNGPALLILLGLLRLLRGRLLLL